MNAEVSGRFMLTGQNLSNEIITQALQLSPTETWTAGSAIQGTSLRREYDAWVYGVSARKTSDVADCIAELLSVLAPIAPRIRQLQEEHELEAEVSCAAYVDRAPPAIHLEVSMLAELAELNAALDIDVILVAD